MIEEDLLNFDEKVLFSVNFQMNAALKRNVHLTLILLFEML